MNILMKQEDVIYSAGLFDGEGSISLAVRSAKRTKYGLPNQSPALYLQTTSTYKEVIKWLRETWGFGSIFTSYRPKRPMHRTAYTWRLSRNDSLTFLKSVLPYLKIKVNQAKLVLQVESWDRASGKKIGEVEMRRRWAIRDQLLILNGRLTPRLKF